ncbi:MAG: efflux RND transporter permease subunit [Solirubrobacteraceae bacterium]
MIGRFNLSEWTLRHPSLVAYLLVLIVALGLYGYVHLGRSEDPPFTFTVMVVRTEWPGASAREVQQQVTDRIVRKLQGTPYVDFLQSYSRPGESTILFNVKDSVTPKIVRATWYQVRKRVGDIAGTLPQGVVGPFFNDEFGDVYTNIYALRGDGYSFAELRDYADGIRHALLRVPGVEKVDFFGEQKQAIYVEPSNAKLAALGLNINALVAALRAQNAVVPGGVYDNGRERYFVRPQGQFLTPAAVGATPLSINGRSFRLADVAAIRFGYQNPPTQSMRFMGQPVLGIGVTMQPGWNVMDLGASLHHEFTTLRTGLPAGLTLATVTSMPRSVARSISNFTAAMAATVIIVLLVSLASLGFRTGMIVVVSIPLVLAATAFGMWMFDIGLDKISLGTLILALGLLVDDAIISVEMMAVKLEQGFDRIKAASFAYTSTAFPMLTGTLVTVSGFLPIALAKSSTGEYTRSIFQVSAIALIASWLAAVVAIPLLGYHLLPDPHRPQTPRSWMRRLPGWVLRRLYPPPHDPNARDPYAGPGYVRLRRVLDWCIDHRSRVLLATVVAFALALAGFPLLHQQFFPDSTRPELVVDLRLAESADYDATLAQVRRMEAFLARQREVQSYVSYVGTGSPRFYLPLNQQLPRPNFAEMIVTARSVAERSRVNALMARELSQHFPAVRWRITQLPNGPPVAFPVQFRVSGPDIVQVQQWADRVATAMRADPRTQGVQYDWDEPSLKSIRLHLDPARLRALGLTPQAVSDYVNAALSGITATQYLEDNRLVDVVVRAPRADRTDLDRLQALTIPLPAGGSVPLGEIARPAYGIEYGVIWQRGREPTLTVQSDVKPGLQGIDVSNALDTKLDAIRRAMPTGYRIAVGGAAEQSGKGQASINAEMPVMLVAVLTLLMIQLQSFSRTLMVVLTAPLGLIGVVAALLLSGKPFGFVAMLGTIAMLGIIMRNSVILVDQIEQDLRAGAPQREAIIGAAVRRFRPIMLTAAAAVLGLIPLVPNDFFGPMAVALMGGITIATALTLLFVPALYALVFRVPRTTVPDDAGEHA